MVWAPTIWICLLICLLSQIYIASGSPLPEHKKRHAPKTRIPGKYRNHNRWPGRNYGTWEIEFCPEGDDDDGYSVSTTAPYVQPAAPTPNSSTTTTLIVSTTTPYTTYTNGQMSAQVQPSIQAQPSAAASVPGVQPSPAMPPGSTAPSAVVDPQIPAQPSVMVSASSLVNTPAASSIDTPAPASSANVASSIFVAPSAAAPLPSSVPAPAPPVTGGANIFVAIDSGLPPPQIAPRDGHPEQGAGLANGHSKPIQTNKFYTNWLLGAQTDAVFTLPFSLQWIRGGGSPNSWGIGVSHIDRSETVYGAGNPASYFSHPVGKNSIILSAAELQGQTVLTTTDHGAFSITARLSDSASGQPRITFPVVQGMAMFTAIYSSSTVAISSVIGFRSLSTPTQVGSTMRYTVTLNDGKIWAIYLTPAESAPAPQLSRDASGSLLQGPSGFSGLVQVAKLDADAGDTSTYDRQAGTYVTSATVSGTTSGAYSISWQKGGDTSKTLVMFALPHHLESFASDTKAALTGTTLASLTKGTATAIVADTWNLVEQLPTSMGFAPWSPTFQAVTSLPNSALSLIQNTLATEIGQDYTGQTNLNTVYFSGKGLAKLATLAYLAGSLAKNDGLAATALQKLKDSMNVWVTNRAQSTLVYDTTWKGVVSGTGFTDAGADFGATYYNDHMFHYGYFVYSAAVIATLDPSWLTQGTNKAYVNSLVRDYANSVTDDAYFPFSRCFDWYNGHSWASGLFAAGDGKNIESSSEDTFASFAIKMWGKATGDANMEARGNLMLAVEARVLNDYFLYQASNTVQPPNFIGNKASGILFDNKVDHTTYFGSNIEYIQGIHIIPMGAHSGLTRKQQFVKEEWATYFDNGRADNVDGSWRGLLYGSLALSDPKASWNFFSQSSFNTDWLDNGASRSWYLAIAAALGGV